MDKPEKKIDKRWAILTGVLCAASLVGVVAMRMADVGGILSWIGWMALFFFGALTFSVLRASKP